MILDWGVGWKLWLCVFVIMRKYIFWILCLVRFIGFFKDVVIYFCRTLLNFLVRRRVRSWGFLFIFCSFKRLRRVLIGRIVYGEIFRVRCLCFLIVLGLRYFLDIIFYKVIEVR